MTLLVSFVVLQGRELIVRQDSTAHEIFLLVK